MIVCPENFADVGQPVTVEQIEKTISEVVAGIDCDCLALSGGVDSSLLLWFMLQTRDKVRAFTIGYPAGHPDIEYAKLMVSEFPNRVDHNIFTPDFLLLPERDSDRTGNLAVRMFYEFVGEYSDAVLTGDGIDEFMCGYYAHQSEPTEKTYYDFMRRLRDEQLLPLDRNSGSVRVYLPYIDRRVIHLLAQVPISKKVGPTGRKLLMQQMVEGKVPNSIISRWKYGFCDALKIKKAS